MKIFLISAIILFTTINAEAQSLKKYPISNSGCSLYNYCPSVYKVDKSADSSLVFTGECTSGEVTYGVICVKLLTAVDDLTMAEDLLISYLDYLKSTFTITKAAGYGRGHRLDNNEQTRGILDYWEDDAKDLWKVKAWTNGKFIGVMYAYSQKELPEVKVNAFLESFRMPVE